MTHPPPRSSRLLYAQAGFAITFSTLAGAISALLVGFFAQRYGASELVPRISAFDIVRGGGATPSVSAVLFAFVAWSHGVDESVVTAGRTRALAVSFIALLVGSLVVIPLTLLSNFVVAHFVFDVAWPHERAALSALRLGDLASGFGTLAMYAAAFGSLAWYLAPDLARSSWPLSKKFAGLCVGVIALRIGNGLW